jgi:hypothetical protein
MLAISNLEPRDAYAARIIPDGNVSFNYTLADPLAVPTVVVEFSLGNKDYHGIYHDADDKWEFFSGEEWFVAVEGDSFYRYANATIEKFVHKLLSGPCPNKLLEMLTKKMMQEVTDEIDMEIVNDLLIASGQSPVLVNVPQLILAPQHGQPRKLQVKWSKDESDLASSLDYPILKSRLIN